MRRVRSERSQQGRESAGVVHIGSILSVVCVKEGGFQLEIG